MRYAAKVTVENREFTLDYAQTTRGSRMMTQVIRENGQRVAYFDSPKNLKQKTCILSIPTGKNEKTGITLYTEIKCKIGEFSEVMSKAIAQGLI